MVAKTSKTPVPHLRVVADPANLPAVPDDLSASFLTSILDSSTDTIAVVTVDGALTYMNRNGLCAMEIDDFRAVDGTKWYDMWPESSRADVLEAIAAVRRGDNFRFEAFCPTIKGTPRWWDVSVSPLKSDKDAIEAMVVISRDMTGKVRAENRSRLHEMELQNLIVKQADALRDQKMDLETKDVLMREIDHRMKNSLALLNSLLRMEERSAESEEAKTKIANASSRVASIAKAHEQLFLEPDSTGNGQSDGLVSVSRYLTSLCDELMATVDGDLVTIDVTCDPDYMESDHAVTLGLVMAELVMNAVRHATKPGEPCAIHVQFQKLADSRVLEVSDDGIGLPDGFEPEASKGLGMRIIRSSLLKLEGELTCGKRDPGSFFRVSF